MAEDRGEGTDLSDTDRRPRRRWMKCFSGILLLSLLAGGLYYGSLRYRWQHALAGRVRAIRAAGYPVTVEELDKWYRWPQSDENAAAVILGAASCYAYVRPTDGNTGDMLWPILRGQTAGRVEPLGERARTLLTEFIGANAKALGLLREAATMADSRYPMDAKRAYVAPLMYLGEVVNKASLLSSLAAVLHAENGDPARACEAIVTALAVARSLAPEPMVLCQINRLTCQRNALFALERALNRTKGFTDGQLLALSDAVAGAHDPDGWTRALIGERAILISLCERPGLMDDSSSRSTPLRIFANARKEFGLADRNGVVLLDLMDRLLQARDLPLHERLKAASAVDETRNALPKNHIVVHEFMPSAVSVVGWELMEIARRRTVCCALAVERYRLACGALPQTLDELVPRFLPGVPPDPFDGKPLRYKHLERGYTVYSVGPDETDDGGQERPPSAKGKSSSSAYDMTFTVEQ